MPTVDKVFNLISERAPLCLSEEFKARYSAYDNSGLLFYSGEETDGVLCALDLTLPVVEEAKKRGYKLILTHHPAIFSPIKHILADDVLTPGGALAAAAKNGISVISMHLNADCAKMGIDYFLMSAARLSSGAEALPPESEKIKIFQPLSLEHTGYGRHFPIKSVRAADLADNLLKELGARRMFFYGGKERLINSACCFCGAGLDEDALCFALKNNCGVIITSEVKHHILTAAVGAGINIICLTHYASENYGFKKLCDSAFYGANIEFEYFTDEEML